MCDNPYGGTLVQRCSPTQKSIRGAARRITIIRIRTQNPNLNLKPPCWRAACMNTPPAKKISRKSLIILVFCVIFFVVFNRIIGEVLTRRCSSTAATFPLTPDTSCSLFASSMRPCPLLRSYWRPSGGVGGVGVTQASVCNTRRGRLGGAWQRASQLRISSAPLKKSAGY